MLQIGRKIYYEITSGNIILDTGERSGDVVETTIDQDFELYVELKPYNPDTVRVIQLTFGQYSQNFGKYPYHVDTINQIIVWDTDNPIGASLVDLQKSKIAQLDNMYKQTLTNGFQLTVGTTLHTFGWSTDDKANILVTQQGIDDGLITFPFNYADINGNPVNLTSQTDLNLIKSKAASFFNAQHQQILNLIGQVKTANSVDIVNAVQWTPAVY